MIANERQYAVTLGQRKQFADALAELRGALVLPGEELRVELTAASLQGVINDLDAEISVYQTTPPALLAEATRLLEGVFALSVNLKAAGRPVWDSRPALDSLSILVSKLKAAAACREIPLPPPWSTPGEH